MNITFTDEQIDGLFGAEDAENESPERLKEYFIKNGAYESLRSDLPIRILVGLKGVGKSALIKMSHIEDDESGCLAIMVKPNDVKNVWNEKESNLNELIEIWKTGLIQIIVSKALEGINLSSKYKDNVIIKSLHGVINAVTSAINSSDASESINKNITDKFLNNKKIRIYMDDLDRGWEGKPSDIRNLSAMLNAIRDLCGDQRNIQFRIALRTDVYRLLRTSDESTDKFERHVIPLNWTNHEILVIMAKRVSTYLGVDFRDDRVGSETQLSISRHLYPIVTERFQHVGKWENAPIHRVLLSLTRRRPRDLIKIFYAGAKEARKQKSDKINTTHLRNIFQNYSNERLQDIINEFQFEFYGLRELLYGMKPARRERDFASVFQFERSVLSKKITNLISSNAFRMSGKPYFSSIDIIEFLYKIDFITARREDSSGSIVRLHFDDSPHIISSAGDFGFHWEVHPAYRWALTPGDPNFVVNATEFVTD
jgi:hypothetical protein